MEDIYVTVILLVTFNNHEKFILFCVFKHVVRQTLAYSSSLIKLRYQNICVNVHVYNALVRVNDVTKHSIRLM